MRSTTNNLDGHYIDSDEAASDRLQREGGMGIHLMTPLLTRYGLI
jgi:hypothetical protein